MVGLPDTGRSVHYESTRAAACLI